VSTLKKMEAGSIETSAPIYHTRCITSNNTMLLQVTSHNHKLYTLRQTFLVLFEIQNWTYRHRQRICPNRITCQCRPRK